MDISTLKDLTPAVASIGVLGYTCYLLIKQLGENRADYSNFVNSNNHTTTEMVKEATATMVTTNIAIETHTKTLEKLIDKIDK